MLGKVVGTSDIAPSRDAMVERLGKHRAVGGLLVGFNDGGCGVTGARFRTVWVIAVA